MHPLYAGNGMFASGNVRFENWFINKPPGYDAELAE
jgi:hypothetical protein